MGNCCSTISKKKKKNKPEEVYDPEEPNQKMITDESKKEHSSFDSENVKRALAQDHTVIEEEYDDSSSDESGSHKPQISASRHNKAMGTREISQQIKRLLISF